MAASVHGNWPMFMTEQLAEWVLAQSAPALSPEVRDRLSLHVLDTLGCAIGAIGVGPMREVRAITDDLGGTGQATLVGGGRAPLDRAAFHNTAHTRYLDFMDNFLAPEQSGHPCDTFAAVFACAESTEASGEDFLVALAVAYQVFCRLLEEAPVQERGFDHTVQLAYAMAAGAARALGLDKKRAAHAIAISGTSNQGTVATRSGQLSMWKGLASASTSAMAVEAALLARRGITGPLLVMEGYEGKGGLRQLAGKLEIDWSKEKLDAVLRCSIKKHNAEVHTQTSIDALLDLRHETGARPDDTKQIEVATFTQAYNITGAGEEAGNKFDVRSKEQADHSLPYLLAVALIDGEVTPKQFTPERIRARDVQELLQRVEPRGDYELTQRYPERLPARVTLVMKDGSTPTREKDTYDGFYATPMPRARVEEKFMRLTSGRVDDGVAREIVAATRELASVKVRDLADLLARAHAPAAERRAA